MADKVYGKTGITLGVKEFVTEVKREFKHRMQVAAAKYMQYAERMSSGGGRSQPGGWPGRVTGTFARSFRCNLTDTGRGYEIRLTNAARHAGWLNDGTKGGTVIVPRKSKMLSWRGDGGRRFAKRVIRGKVAPRPWVRLANRGFMPTFRRIVLKPMTVKAGLK